MSLQIWLPLNGNLTNQGINSSAFTSSATYDNNGKIGKCLSSNIILSVQDNLISKITLKNQYSFALWMKSKNSSGWVFRFGDINGNTPSNSRGMWININANYEFAYQNSGTAIGSASTICDNNWHHIVYTVDDKSALIYVDGKLVQNLTLSYNQQLNYEYIQLNGNTNYINDFRIYDHCLSLKEVKELAKGLVLHYRLAGPGQPNLIKASGPNEDGWGINQSGGTFTKTITAEGTSFEVTTQATSWFLYYHKFSNLSTAGLKPNTEYTYSFECKSNQSFNLDIKILKGNGTIPLTNNKTVRIEGDSKWHKYKVTLTTNSTLDISDQYFYMTGGNLISKTQFRYAKLEEGTIATPWTPHSSDTLWTTMGYSNNIEYDCSGYGNNGTKAGNITWDIDSPRYTTSYKFAAGSNISVSSGFPTGINPQFTLNFWFNPPSNFTYVIYTDVCGLHCTTTGYSDTWCRLEVCGSPVGSDWSWFRGFQPTSSNFPVNNIVQDAWNMITLVSDGTKIYTYTNGINTGTVNTTEWQPDGDFRLGDSASGISGKYSDLRIYATALSAKDIEELYHSAVIVDNTGKTYAYEYFEG